MKPIENQIGNKFNRLTVIDGPVRVTKNNRVAWVCVCDCGNVTTVETAKLKNGHTKSCGCYHREMLRIAHTTHGDSYSRLHKIWTCMKERCNNPNNPAYAYYGGRGISVCEDWREYENFQRWALSSGYDERLTLDRIDVNGNYDPQNCRWADRYQQARNKRDSKYYTLNGVTMHAHDWDDKLGGAHGLTNRRIRMGWSVERALTTPSKAGRNQYSEK